MWNNISRGKDTNNKFYSLKCDAVFKNVFYKNKKLLKKFLTDILSNFYDNLKIDKIEILNCELTKDRIYIKNKIVDILVDIGYAKINVEVNVDYDDERIYRNFFYLVQSTIEDVKKSENYVDIKEHIQININFKKAKSEGFEISQYINTTTKKPTIPFMKTIDINVDYFMDKWYTLGNKEYYEKNKSIIMFGLDEEDFKKLEDDDEYMKKIKEEVEELNRDPNFYQWMSDEEDRIMMENSKFFRGKKEGIEQGSQIKQEELIRKMKEEKIQEEIISKITGLSIEEINNIAQ